jgi:sporulation protein YlmC with PRC-barrel domain
MRPRGGRVWRSARHRLAVDDDVYARCRRDGVDPVAFISRRLVREGMPDILAENISDKAVMGSDGTELGALYNVTMDLKSGELHDLIVVPDEETPTRAIDYDRDEQGRFRVPVAHVQAVKDYIVVDR